MKLGILLLTYDRLAYAERTLITLHENLVWGDQMHVHIADDGSPGEYRQRLEALVDELWPEHGRTTTNSKRSGYGSNYNHGTQVLHQTCDVVLTLEDDWELERRLDLHRFAACLGDDVQCIRFGYLGMTQALRGEVRYVADVPLLLLDPASEERHVNAGHPRLETVVYQRSIGPWAEGLNPGATEFEWCGREAARQKVAWPLEVPPQGGGMFGHIGAEQAREDQR
jgi:hypothetical protein